MCVVYLCSLSLCPESASSITPVMTNEREPMQPSSSVLMQWVQLCISVTLEDDSFCWYFGDKIIMNSETKLLFQRFSGKLLVMSCFFLQVIYLKRTPEEVYRALISGTNVSYLPFRWETEHTLWHKHDNLIWSCVAVLITPHYHSLIYYCMYTSVDRIQLEHFFPFYITTQKTVIKNM